MTVRFHSVFSSQKNTTTPNEKMLPFFCTKATSLSLHYYLRFEKSVRFIISMIYFMMLPNTSTRIWHKDLYTKSFMSTILWGYISSLKCFPKVKRIFNNSTDFNDFINLNIILSSLYFHSFIKFFFPHPLGV